MIVNIRGTNGSGKTTLVRSLIAMGNGSAQVDLAPYFTKGGKERFVPGTTFILPNGKTCCAVGNYAGPNCGGCDTIKTQDLICASVEDAAKRFDHVLFEGVIVSTLYSRYAKLDAEMYRKYEQMTVWLYLLTPTKLCLNRIQKRNGGKPINEQLVEDKVRAITITMNKAFTDERAVKLIKTGNLVKMAKEVLSWLDQ